MFGCRDHAKEALFEPVWGPVEMWGYGSDLEARICLSEAFMMCRIVEYDDEGFPNVIGCDNPSMFNHANYF